MIVLCLYSSSLLANNSRVPFTGGEHKDSVYVSYDNLRVANAKMIELEYQKQINAKLNDIVISDSIIKETLKKNNNELLKTNNKYKKQLNIWKGITLFSGIILIIDLFK
jgi:hypothetical protein